MGVNLLTEQSMKIISYLGTVFGNLEVWNVKTTLIYFPKIFNFLTFQTSKLPIVPNKRINMTTFSCIVRPEKFHPYMQQR